MPERPLPGPRGEGVARPPGRSHRSDSWCRRRMPVTGPLVRLRLHVADRALVPAGARVEVGEPLLEHCRELATLEVPSTAGPDAPPCRRRRGHQPARTRPGGPRRPATGRSRPPPVPRDGRTRPPRDRPPGCHRGLAGGRHRRGGGRGRARRSGPTAWGSRVPRAGACRSSGRSSSACTPRMPSCGRRRLTSARPGRSWSPAPGSTSRR